ncbi:MAG TPA: hypothetical protein VK524_08940 [Polyangiaceae bacterium]|nr:hypothetical protein [Polyangiaceae bacterium]
MHADFGPHAMQGLHSGPPPRIVLGKAMSDVARLKRVLISLPELGLRIDWLKQQLREWDVADACRLLNELCEESERADPAAREAQLALALAFVSLPADELDGIYKHARAARLFSLERMLRRSPSVLPAPSDTPIPDYGAGRELTVGERRSLARRPNRKSFAKLLGDPHPLVIRQLLQNPRLTEDDVVRLVARRPPRTSVLDELAHAPQWLCRPRVRLAVLFNPGAKSTLTMPLLGACTRTELREIIASDTPVALRATALELLERRPPLRNSRTGNAPLQ